MEETWLPAATLAKIRRGDFPELQQSGSTPDLFGEWALEVFGLTVCVSRVGLSSAEAV
jgi:hypothetical protein